MTFNHYVRRSCNRTGNEVCTDRREGEQIEWEGEQLDGEASASTRGVRAPASAQSVRSPSLEEDEDFYGFDEEEVEREREEIFIQQANVGPQRVRALRRRNSRRENRVALVRQSFIDHPNLSVEDRSSSLNIPRTTLFTIRKELGLLNRDPVVQFSDVDKERRMRYCTWITAQVDQDPNFIDHIIMSDEVVFALQGEYRTNLHYTRNRLNPDSVHVWCGVWSGGMLGPYFFKDDAGNAATLTAPRYHAMLTSYLQPEIQRLGLRDMWFQQDGAAAHICWTTMPQLRALFSWLRSLNRGRRYRTILRYMDFVWDFSGNR